MTCASEQRGTFFRAFNLAKYLVKGGHKICLICGDKQGKLRLSSKFVENVEVITVPYSFRLAKWSFAQAVDGLINTLNILTRESDLVHFFAPNAPSVAFSLLFARCERILSSKVIMTDWDDWWGQGGIYARHGLLVHEIGTLLEEQSPFLADGTTVVSSILHQRAVRLGLKNVFTVPNGSNVDEIKPIPKSLARCELSLPDDSVVFCHIGLADLSKTVSLIKKKIPKALVLVVGGKPGSNKQLIHWSGIIYTGHQPYNRIPLYLAAADILLLKTENEIAEAARWPIRLGDYLAAGRPIVTGDIGETGRVIRENACGLLARPGDPIDLAKRAIEAASMPAQWTSMGHNARTAAEKKFSWQIVAQQLEKVYDKYIEL